MIRPILVYYETAQLIFKWEGSYLNVLIAFIYVRKELKIFERLYLVLSLNF
jgi:hypothetical protein